MKIPIKKYEVGQEDMSPAQELAYEAAEEANASYLAAHYEEPEYVNKDQTIPSFDPEDTNEELAEWSEIERASQEVLDYEFGLEVFAKVCNHRSPIELYWGYEYIEPQYVEELGKETPMLVFKVFSLTAMTLAEVAEKLAGQTVEMNEFTYKDFADTDTFKRAKDSYIDGEFGTMPYFHLHTFSDEQGE